MTCSIDGCERPAVARGLCRVCHQRARRAAKRAQQGTQEDRRATLVVQSLSDSTKPILFSLRLSEHEHRQLVRIAQQRNTNMSDALRQLIREEAEQ